MAERKLFLEEAVRECFYEISISTLAHEYASVVEFREPSEVIVSACGKEQRDFKKLPYEMRRVMEATRDSVLMLIPERYVSFSEIAEKIKTVCDKIGYVNIAISKDFKLNPNDELLKEVLAKDPVAMAKFKDEGVIDNETGLVGFDSEVSYFIVALFRKLSGERKIKIEGTKITDMGYAFKGLAKSSDFKSEYLLDTEFLEAQGVVVRPRLLENNIINRTALGSGV